jgi:hypothetical protein
MKSQIEFQLVINDQVRNICPHGAWVRDETTHDIVIDIPLLVT